MSEVDYEQNMNKQEQEHNWRSSLQATVKVRAILNKDLENYGTKSKPGMNFLNFSRLPRGKEPNFARFLVCVINRLLRLDSFSIPSVRTAYVIQYREAETKIRQTMMASRRFLTM